MRRLKCLLLGHRPGPIVSVLGIEVRRSLGFELPPTSCGDGRPPSAFGHPGASGFLAFADPQARMFPVAVTFLVPRKMASS